MAKRTITIDSIFEGHSPTQYFATKGQYNSSLAIDPDYPINSSNVKTSGFAVPIGYSEFSGSNVNAAPIAIINNPKNTLTYVVLKNGRLISYNSSLASETLIGTVTGSVANGAWYYNNYIYITTGTDVSRYGPLNNSPSLTNTVWTGATLGSLTALTNTPYPTVRDVALPNHWGFAHADGSSYFLDFKNGQGMVHRINTKKGTDEGDTNGTVAPSAYNVLDLPFGFYPTAICAGPNGNDIAILGIQTTDSTIDQGKPGLFLWDPTDTDSFYAGPINQADALGTALLNDNGVLKVWTGNASAGVRLSKYVGGQLFTEIVYQEESTPPFPGAVDAKGSRLVWGGWTTYPYSYACVWAYGSKNDALPKGIHNIATPSSADASNITALRFVQQASNKIPQMVLGWNYSSDGGLDKYSATASLGSVIRWMFNIGKKFNLEKIRIPLAGAVNANTTIAPMVSMDDISNSQNLTVINNSNYPGKRKVIYRAPELIPCTGQNNFALEFEWGGTNPLPIAFPIEIEINEHDDEL